MLQREEYQDELTKKAKEELQEYIEAQTHQEAIEELADLLEVMHALAAVHGSTPEQLEKVRGGEGQGAREVWMIGFI